MFGKKSSGRARERSGAKSAFHGAFFCWALIKGGVLCCLLVIPGDLTISLQSRTPVQAGIFLFVYSTAVLLYLKLVKSDPGFMQTEEHHTLLEDGEIRRLSKDSHDSSNGVELRQRVGNVGPSKEEPDLRTSLAAALDPHAHNDPDSDSEDVNAAEEFLGRVSKHVSERRHRRGPGPAAHVENTVAAEGAVEEGAAEGAAETRRKLVNDDGLSEITLCVEENSASTIHQDAAEASSEQRQCSLCNVKQPLRTKHCYACGRCVNTFDHHCFWIGNCVGEKNHRLFWWFLFSETLTVCWASSLAASTFQYTDGANFISGWFMLNTPSLICLMMCLGFVVMMAALLGFHSYLIYTGQTTWEVMWPKKISYMRGLPKDIYPFSEGGCANIKAVCLRSSKSPARMWPEPVGPYKDTQRFWWIENEYWSCF